MANSTAIQTLMDGRENVLLKVLGVLDTSDLGSTVVADPASFNDMGPFPGVKASALRIKNLMFNVEDSLSVNLFWDATTPLLIGEFVGRGQQDYRPYGGLQNNSGAGKTGKITMTTQGWATSAILSFELILHLGKQ